MVPTNQERAQAAWQQIQALGGHGVWKSDMVVVSLADTRVTDEDLTLFADFPDVQILDLSNTGVTDKCLEHLSHLDALTSLVLVGTAVQPESIEEFKSAHIQSVCFSAIEELLATFEGTSNIYVWSARI